MKKLLLGMVAGLMALTACTNDAIDNEAVENGQNKSGGISTFYATIGNGADTRAVISNPTGDGNKKIVWEKEDQINVFALGSTEMKRYTLRSIENGKGVFSGEEVSGEEIYAVYPGDDGWEFLEGDPSVLLRTLPAESDESSIKNNFQLQVPMIAKAEGNQLHFANTSNLVHITISDIYYLESVVIKDNAGNPIAGKGWIEVDYDPEYSGFDDEMAASEKVLNFFNYTGEDNVDIYFNVLNSGFLAGMTVEITGEDKDMNPIHVTKRSFDTMRGIGNVFHFPVINVAEEQADTKQPVAYFTDCSGIRNFYYDKFYKEGETCHLLEDYFDDEAFAWELPDPENIFKVIIDPSFASYKPESTAKMFYNCKELTEIVGLEYLNTSLVTNMSYMFAHCDKLREIDVSHFNTSEVRNMSSMFASCVNVQSLDLSNFDTSKVKDMNSMFRDCAYNLKTLDLTSFNTQFVEKMYSMFQNCGALTSLDVSSFNTSMVTSMSAMFGSCKNLTSLDVSSFNTAKVTNMIHMFSYCHKLTELDLSNFDTSKVEQLNYMFYKDENLTTIYGTDWNLSQLKSSDDMFTGCTSLTGGEGSRIVDCGTDYRGAHIDKMSEGNPGLFTLK